MEDFRGRLGALLLLVLLTGCGPSGKLGSVNAVPPSTSVALSGTSFDFGQNLVGNPSVQTAVTVSNTGSNSLSLSPSLTGDASYSIVAGQSCGAQLAPGATCAVVVSYAPTAAATQTATINLNYGDAVAGSPSTVSLTGTAAAMAAGTVTPTANPQVALYTITPPFAGNVTVSFGPTTAYGLNTWSQATPSGGGPVSIEVAGMLANTTYHLRASIQFANGISANDLDHTFASGVSTINTPPVPFTPQITATTSPGMVPQPGIELINSLPSGQPAQGLYATDLQGRVIWNYSFSDYRGNDFIQGVKQLPNGHFLIIIGANSEVPLQGGIPAGTLIAVREIDLAGNVVKQITLQQLNAAMLTAGFNVNLLDFHHDIEVLPNGHWLILANTMKQFTDLPGMSGNTNVLGDVIVDVDTNLKPVWVWNEFDHLDVNHHPMGFPDWTHSNAIIYSSDDGNFIVSLRHQNWLVKVNYANGAGDGSVLWKLGQGGDFTLKNETDPTDWHYAQHGPDFFSTSNAGIFSLGVMDNGDDRTFPSGITCGTAGNPPCLYSTVPIMQINESAKTASLTFHQIVPTNLYNSFGGDVNSLANGNVEYDLCGEVTGTNSDVYEVTQNDTPQTVWHLHSTGTQLFRTYRLPSLYPGVQW